MAGMFKGVAVGGCSDGYVIRSDISPMRAVKSLDIPAFRVDIDPSAEPRIETSVYKHHAVVIGPESFEFWAPVGVEPHEALLTMLRAYGPKTL